MAWWGVAVRGFPNRILLLGISTSAVEKYLVALGRAYESNAELGRAKKSLLEAWGLVELNNLKLFIFFIHHKNILTLNPTNKS